MSQHRGIELTHIDTRQERERSIYDDLINFFSDYQDTLNCNSIKGIIGVTVTVLIVSAIVVASFTGCSKIEVKNHTFDTIVVNSESPYRVRAKPTVVYPFDTLKVELNGEYGKVYTDEGTFHFNDNGHTAKLEHGTGNRELRKDAYFIHDFTCHYIYDEKHTRHLRGNAAETSSSNRYWLSNLWNKGSEDSNNALPSEITYTA